MHKSLLKMILLGVFLFLIQTSAQAQEFDVLKARPMPQISTIPPESLAAQTDIHEAVPAGDLNLAYRVHLPKGWVMSKDAGLGELRVSKVVLGEIVRYYSPPKLDKRSSFSIEASQLDYEISAKNWFTNFILSNGYTLEGMNIISDTKVEAIYVYIEKDISYVVRTLAEVVGTRVILARYFVPYDFWTEEKAIQAGCIRSFTLTNPDRRPVEILDHYVFLDLIEFEYPISWAARSPGVSSLERMEATLISSSDMKILTGQIDVQVISRKQEGVSVKDEIAKLRDRIASRSDFRTGERIELITTFQFQPEIRAATVEAYGGTSTDDYQRLIGYEIWSAVLVEDDYYYLMAMLTPARTNDFLAWARNAKTFERVVESIHSDVSDKDPGAAARREQERQRREADAVLERPEWELSPEKQALKHAREKARERRNRRRGIVEEETTGGEENTPAQP